MPETKPAKPPLSASDDVWADYHTKMARYHLKWADAHTQKAKALKFTKIPHRGKVK